MSDEPAPNLTAASELTTCEPAPTDLHEPLFPGEAYEPFTPEQRQLATKLLAIFENRATSLQYAYAENIEDGRGFTVGAVGFTTGTGDALEVIRTYERLAQREPGDRRRAQRVAEFGRFAPILERLHQLPLNDPGRGSVEGLDRFDRIWTRTAEQDPLFRAAQDSVAEELYYTPALRFAHMVGLRTGLGKAAVLDAIVQHGGGEDPDGLPAMLTTVYEERGEPNGVIDERRWIARFLELREAVLSCARTPETREGWRASRTRVDVYQQLLDSGNIHLQAPLTFMLDGREWVIELDP